jgi:hypothetical protein
VVNAAFLLAADIAVKSFCPGQRSTPGLGWTFFMKVAYIGAVAQHEGQRRNTPICLILPRSHKPELPNSISLLAPSLFYTAVHRSSTIFGASIHENETFVG